MLRVLTREIRWFFARLSLSNYCFGKENEQAKYIRSLSIEKLRDNCGLRHFIQVLSCKYVYMITLKNNLALRRSLTKDVCQTGGALLLILFGGLIYIGFRPNNLRLFDWADAIGLNPIILSIRELLCNISVGNIVRFSLPDGLWLLGYLLIIDAIWRDESLFKLFFITLLPLIAICMEFLQLANIISGVFDVLDLAAYLGAIMIYKLLKTYVL